MKTSFLYSTAVATLLFVACQKTTEESPKQTLPNITDIRNVGKLTLAEMTITKLGTIEDLGYDDAKTMRQKGKAILNYIKIGERKGAYSYDTYLRAYINLSQLSDQDLQIDSTTHIATLHLPSIETSLAGREPQLREEHYRVTGLRSNISPQERAQLKEEMNTMLRAEVKENELFNSKLSKKAEEKAQIYFTNFFKQFGYTVNIIFK